MSVKGNTAAPQYSSVMKEYLTVSLRVQELCESRGGRPEVAVLNSLYIYIDRFYIALFSALEQTHGARM